jgi:hypothetical protein
MYCVVVISVDFPLLVVDLEVDFLHERAERERLQTGLPGFGVYHREVFLRFEHEPRFWS